MDRVRFVAGDGGVVGRVEDRLHRGVRHVRDGGLGLRLGRRHQCDVALHHEVGKLGALLLVQQLRAVAGGAELDGDLLVGRDGVEVLFRLLGGTAGVVSGVDVGVGLRRDQPQLRSTAPGSSGRCPPNSSGPRSPSPAGSCRCWPGTRPVGRCGASWPSADSRAATKPFCSSVKDLTAPSALSWALTKASRAMTLSISSFRLACRRRCV